MRFFNCWARAWEARDRTPRDIDGILAALRTGLPKISRVREEFLAERITPIKQRSEGGGGK